jgi:cytochrome bd-type quinol oxidase subunit 2
MKKIYSKIPAMIGMLVTMIGVVLLIGAFIISNNEVELESGASRSFALAILGLITALCSLIFYLIDAVLSVIKAFKKIHPIFNGTMALIIISTVPIVFAKSGLPDIRIAICAVTIFVFEIISVIKHIQLMMNDKQKQNIE